MSVVLLGFMRTLRIQRLMKAAADIISTVEFDQTGNYLATGDKGGRVVLFERNETVCLQLQSSRPLSWPPCLSVITNLTYALEKDMRIQVPYRVPVTRTGI
jgi:hypothetical protein